MGMSNEAESIPAMAHRATTDGWLRMHRRALHGLRALSLASLLVTCGCGLLFHRDLPRQMVGYKQTLVLRDAGGLAEVQRLTERSIAVRSGGFAVYGGGAVSVWAASAQDTAAARQWVDDVSARIAAGDSPFHADSVSIIGGREVRMFSGIGQRHFWFRAGRHVVWLASNAGHATEALDEALKFYRE